MKKNITITLVLVACFLTLYTTYSHATLWSYSAFTQGTLKDETTPYDIYFNITISDRLWDRYDDIYIIPIQGEPLPTWHRFLFKVYDWSIDIIGVEQLSGQSGSVEAGVAMPEGTIQEYDSLVLSGIDSFLYFDRGPTWLDYEGNPWGFYDVNSPVYGQLAPVLVYTGSYGDFGGTSCTLSLIRNPNPVAPEPVPEPATIILLCFGIAGLIGSSRKIFKRKNQSNENWAGT